MKRISALQILVLAIFFACQASAAPAPYKQKKFFGPIPLNNVSLSMGFIDGPTDEYLAGHLANWATDRGGEDYFEVISTSPFVQIGYERMLSPFHFARANLTFCHLKNRSIGYFYTLDPDPEAEPPQMRLDFDRELRIYYLSLDLGFGYYLVEPKVRSLAPYISGGFSGVLPMARLDTDAVRESGESYDLPDENVEQNSLQAGLHAEFGLRYFITDRYGAGIEGRYQMSQSKFEIHNYNFDMDYSGLSFALNAYYYF